MSILASVQMSVTYKHSKSSPEAPCSYLSVLESNRKTRIHNLVRKLMVSFAPSLSMALYYINKKIFLLAIYGDSKQTRGKINHLFPNLIVSKHWLNNAIISEPKI